MHPLQAYHRDFYMSLNNTFINWLSVADVLLCLEQENVYSF